MRPDYPRIASSESRNRRSLEPLSYNVDVALSPFITGSYATNLKLYPLMSFFCRLGTFSCPALKNAAGAEVTSQQ